ncbi:MAG: hypothetical protein JKZ03_07725 [Flavobacteriaceae bacterium]|nr:hypothetical protein [Flavobacteriaceae bacterium]
MSNSEEDKLTQIIRNCLSEEEKKKVLAVYEKYENDSEDERNKFLNGKKSSLIPIISVNFGWVYQLALHKCNEHQH